MTSNPILLGVNVDHVATLRQARGVSYPDPLQAALIAEHSGADGITIHLREDRRHIQDHDFKRFVESLQTRLNFECAAIEEMIVLMETYQPAHCCLVPEKRAELTTEGGLDIIKNKTHLTAACARLAQANVEVSLFIDPDIQQIEASHAVGAPAIELHTGCYADAPNLEQQKIELTRLVTAAQHAHKLGLIVNAGHGLHYHNVQAIAAIPEINELNIGHSIVARAVLSGFSEAVSTMKRIIVESRQGFH